jgi:hypothetical protein
VFAGFLVFDAWIANTDRHAMNWAVLEHGGLRRLASSFDHGSALASGNRDAKLSLTDPADVAARGMASRFENGAALPLVDLALKAVDTGGPRARERVDRVVGFEQGHLEAILAVAVTTSDVRRTFLGEVLRLNQGRLRV